MRVRRRLSVIVLLVSMWAITATSPPQAFTESGVYSGRVLLSRDAPEVRIPFEVEASDVALDQGDFALALEIDTTWAGVDSAAAARGVDVTVEWPGGVVRHLRSSEGRLTCGVECAGAGAVVLRWPAESLEGEAAVAWSLQAVSSFDLVSDPPKGAEVTLDVVAPPRQGEYVISQTIPADALRPATRATFRLVSSEQVRPGDLAVERSRRSGRDWAQVTVDGVALPPAGIAPLEVPSVCDVGPCEIEVEVIALSPSTRPLFGSNEEIRIVTLGPTVEGEMISLELLEGEPIGVITKQYSVVAGSVTRLTLHAEFIRPSEAVLQPVIVIDPRLEIVDGALAEDQTASLAMAGEDGSVARLRGAEDLSHSQFVIASSCVALRCSATAPLEVTLSGDGAPGMVMEVALVVTAYVDAGTPSNASLDIR